MNIQRVADIIHKIADGFEQSCARCLQENSGVVLQAVKEQLYSGQNGEGGFLTPDYDHDPYFDEVGFWYQRADSYKAWKRKITPPIAGTMLGLPPRPDDTPNLFIDGTFYAEITARPQGTTLIVDPGNGNGPQIVAKYGDNILTMGPDAIEYFNLTYMIPNIEDFYRSCGYR